MLNTSNSSADQNGTNHKKAHDSSYYGYLNKGEEEEMEIRGFKESQFRLYITWFFIIITLGILRLIFFWTPRWMLYCTHVKCSVKRATTILVIENNDGLTNYYVERVSLLTKAVNNNKTMNNNSETQNYSNIGNRSNLFGYLLLDDGSRIKITNFIRSVVVKKHQYIWNENKSSFVKLTGLDKNIKKSDLCGCSGLSANSQETTRGIYGYNEVIYPVQSIGSMVIQELLSPLYVYQELSMLVWLLKMEWFLVLFIGGLSAMGVSLKTYNINKSQKQLEKIIHASGEVIVQRDNGLCEKISSRLLVPGDVIVIPNEGCAMLCDAVLIQGSCFVIESMLTGESVPLLKSSLDNSDNELVEANDSNHFLYSGTKVLQTRKQVGQTVLAVVVRTGFLTTKGNLVRQILYPPPGDTKFLRDSYKFMWVLSFIGLINSIYGIFTQKNDYLSTYDSILYYLQKLTNFIPPALPFILSVGSISALQRLRDQKILCLNSRLINVAGMTDCVVFDKTGTLTTEDLDLWGVVPVQDDKIQESTSDLRELGPCPIVFGMASCHSLTLVNNAVTGDPLDVKMFESTKWEFKEASSSEDDYFSMAVPVVHSPCINNSTDLGILHLYQFVGHLKRMSVLVKQRGKPQVFAFCKGSPDVIKFILKNIPEDYESTLAKFTKKGYRVLAIAWKTLDIDSNEELKQISREEIECQLQFAGFIVFENRVKPESAPLVDRLKKANIRVVMCTGDNLQTALSVSRECGILTPDEPLLEIDLNGSNLTFDITYSVDKMTNQGLDIVSNLNMTHYKIAITGQAWNYIKDSSPDLLKAALLQGSIFSGMSGNQKQQLVLELRKFGYTTIMCGDGSNDCGALKAANAGLALSDESSVAAPFTSTRQDLNTLPILINEGRASIVTTVGIFKFIVHVCIMFDTSGAILNSITCSISDVQNTLWNICYVGFFSAVFGRNPAITGGPVSQRPVHDLFSLSPLLSLVVQSILSTSFILASFYIVQQFSWFEPWDKSSIYCTSYENYAIYSVMQFQFIISVITNSVWAPFRQNLISNRMFFIMVLLTTGFSAYMTLIPAEAVQNTFKVIIPPSYDFRFVTLGLVLAHFILSFLFEKFIIEYLIFKYVRYFRHDPNKSKRKYLGFKSVPLNEIVPNLPERLL